MPSTNTNNNLLPVGQYTARPVGWMLTETKSGAEQYAVELELQDGSGQRLTWFGGFSSDKATEITVKALRTLGWQGDDLDNVQLNAEADVRIVVEHDEYQGRPQVRVRWINPLGGLTTRAPLDAGRRKGFAERMKGAIAGIDARSGQAPAAQRPTQAQPRPSNGARPAQAPAIDEDIPF